MRTEADAQTNEAIADQRPVWVVIPALNEAENLAVLLPVILEQGVVAESGGSILIVDDGSTDTTAEVVRHLGTVHPQIRLLSFVRNRGKAAALQDGFGLALEAGAGVVVMMDADGQDDPTELPGLIARLDQGADLVTGARMVRRDRFIKRHTSRLYNRTTSWLSGTPGKDFNSGYKVMRAEVARDVAPMMYGEMHRYLTVIAHWKGYRTAEVPVEHHPRMFGTSKYGIARFWRGFVDLVTIRFLMTYENRPSHLFGGLGATLGGVGGLMLLYLLILRIAGQQVGDRPMLIAAVLLVVVGVQLAVFGLLSELIVYLRNRDRALDRLGR